MLLLASKYHARWRWEFLERTCIWQDCEFRESAFGWTFASLHFHFPDWICKVCLDTMRRDPEALWWFLQVAWQRQFTMGRITKSSLKLRNWILQRWIFRQKSSAYLAMVIVNKVKLLSWIGKTVLHIGNFKSSKMLVTDTFWYLVENCHPVHNVYCYAAEGKL